MLGILYSPRFVVVILPLSRIAGIGKPTRFKDTFLSGALELFRAWRCNLSPQLAACFNPRMPADIGRTAAAEANIDVIGDLGCVAVAAAHLIVGHIHLGGHGLTHDRPEPGSLVAAHGEDREGSIEFRGHEDPTFACAGGALIHGDSSAEVRP